MNSHTTTQNTLTTLFFKTVIVLVAIGALAFLLWEPRGEGVNAGATTFSEIYLDDPFLAYAYIASLPFFVGLYQLFRLAGLSGRNKFISQSAANELRTIRYCALVMIPFIAGGVTWLLFTESDDRPPLMMMATIAIVICISIAIGAMNTEKNVRAKMA